jgi:hypothetical protein
MDITNNALKIMLHKIETELTVIELFAYAVYCQPRDIQSGEHHPSIYSPDNPAFTYTLDTDYQRCLQAIIRVEALRESISERL